MKDFKNKNWYYFQNLKLLGLYETYIFTVVSWNEEFKKDLYNMLGIK